VSCGRRGSEKAFLHRRGISGGKARWRFARRGDGRVTPEAGERVLKKTPAVGPKRGGSTNGQNSIGRLPNGRRVFCRGEGRISLPRKDKKAEKKKGEAPRIEEEGSGKKNSTLKEAKKLKGGGRNRESFDKQVVVKETQHQKKTSPCLFEIEGLPLGKGERTIRRKCPPCWGGDPAGTAKKERGWAKGKKRTLQSFKGGKISTGK